MEKVVAGLAAVAVVGKEAAEAEAGEGGERAAWVQGGRATCIGRWQHSQPVGVSQVYMFCFT